MKFSIFKTISIAIIIILLSFNISYAKLSKNEEKLFEFINSFSLFCIDRGQEYYVDVNTQMTPETLAYDKGVESIVKNCMLVSAESFYFGDNDIEFNNYLVNIFKNKTVGDRLYGIAYCSFVDGYFFSKSTKGKKMSLKDKAKGVKECMEYGSKKSKK